MATFSNQNARAVALVRWGRRLGVPTVADESAEPECKHEGVIFPPA